MNTYVVVDLETTGLAAKTDKILEIGAWKMAGGQCLASYHVLVDPGMKIPERITELTGITDDMVKGQIKADTAIAAFADFCGDLPLLGHNLMFDYAFLKHAAVNHNIPFEKEGADTLKISRKVLPDLPSKALGAMCSHYGIQQSRAHRADDDAYVTALLFEQLKRDFMEKEPELFQPQSLIYKAKKQSPITNAQKGYLNDLIKYHKIKFDMQIDSLTKSEASRLIDGIILQHGRIIRK